MIEHTIKDHPDSLLMTFLYKCLQIIICSKAAVQLLIIGCLISMSYRFKQRSNIKCVKSCFFYMFHPRQQCIQPMHRFSIIICFRGSCQSQWINVIKYCLVIPCHTIISLQIYHVVR